MGNEIQSFKYEYYNLKSNLNNENSNIQTLFSRKINKPILTNEFFIQNWELLDILINDLLNKYNPFFDYKLQWFINESKTVIENLGGK